MMNITVDPWDNLPPKVPVRVRRALALLDDGGHALSTVLGAAGCIAYADGLLREPTERQEALNTASLWPWFWFAVGALFTVSLLVQIFGHGWRVGPHRVRMSTITTLVATAGFLAVAAGRSWLWWVDGDGFASRSRSGLWIAVCGPLVLILSGTISIIIRSTFQQAARLGEGGPPKERPD